MSGRAGLDALVIGGGVIGLAAALRLRQRGLSVTLLERSECGREASWAGAGMLIPPNPNRRGPMQQLVRRSLELYRAFCEELTELSGIDAEYESCGAMEILTSDQRYRMALSEQRAAAQPPSTRDSVDASGERVVRPPEFEVLDIDAARVLEPGLAPAVAGTDQVKLSIVGVLHVRDAAQVRNPRLLTALQAACRQTGVHVRERASVSELMVDGARVVGAKIGDEALRAERTVVCAGAWSSGVCGELGPSLPVYPVRGQIVLLRMPKRPLRHLIIERSTYLVPRRDGHVLIGSTEEHDSGFEKRNTPSAIQRMLQTAAAMAPCLADASVVGMWSGLRPGTPDRRPYLGLVPGVAGLIAATGHFRMGLTLAPVTAEIVADLVTAGTTAYDLSLCRPGRSSPRVRSDPKKDAPPVERD